MTEEVRADPCYSTECLYSGDPITRTGSSNFDSVGKYRAGSLPEIRKTKLNESINGFVTGKHENYNDVFFVKNFN